ncbi:hypothetical protein NFI96_023556 [Prochilodus magdalenae]|nr:hypothetical protein NFI96_023556 [Prochilodus magdalenae]
MDYRLYRVIRRYATSPMKPNSTDTLTHRRVGRGQTTTPAGAFMQLPAGMARKEAAPPAAAGGGETWAVSMEQDIDFYKHFRWLKKVSVLTEQVEAQGEKIRDLEVSLEEHHHKLLSTEEMLQQLQFCRARLRKFSGLELTLHSAGAGTQSENQS